MRRRGSGKAHAAFDYRSRIEGGARPAGEKRGPPRPLPSRRTYYESGELVFSALAGTPIETIETMLAKNAQELAFEPMSFAALYGTGSGTIGGALMANLSGPRRIKAGAARGVAGLRDRSSRPKRLHRPTPHAVVDRV